jgi:hypothetical protein
MEFFAAYESAVQEIRRIKLMNAASTNSGGENVAPICGPRELMTDAQIDAMARRNCIGMRQRPELAFAVSNTEMRDNRITLNIIKLLNHDPADDGENYNKHLTGGIISGLMPMLDCSPTADVLADNIVMAGHLAPPRGDEAQTAS